MHHAELPQPDHSVFLWVWAGNTVFVTAYLWFSSIWGWSSSDSTCGVSLGVESLREIIWTLEWLRESKVGMLPQCRANWQNYTAQPARKEGGCWWQKKTFHATELRKTINRCLASHTPKVLIKSPVSECVSHSKSWEPKTFLFYMTGNRPYTGNWGINRYLQDLGTQNLPPSQFCIRMPALCCPGPVPVLDSPFPCKGNPIASAGNRGMLQAGPWF